MILTIFETLTSYIAVFLEWLVNIFLSCLDLSLSAFLNAFPAFGTTYSIFRMIGLSLALIIAIVSLFRFFTSQDSSSIESPVRVLLRTAAASAAIYFGGYVLEFIVRLASFSYGIFLNLDAAPKASMQEIFSPGYISHLPAGNLGAEIAVGVLPVICALVFVIIIAKNLGQLLIEVAERYLLVGVLVFTAPLPFSTIASQNSSTVFKNWCKMFFSSCILMTLSVFFLKLIVSALYAIQPDGYWLQLLLVLAMCKIARRVDTYMAQLGLGTAITGGNTMGDLLAGFGLGGRLLSRASGKSGGSKTSILGASKNAIAAGGSAKEGRIGGALGALANSARSGFQAISQGKSGKDTRQAFRQGFINTYKRTALGGAVAGAVTEANASQAKGESKAKQALAGAAGAATGAVAGVRDQIEQLKDPTYASTKRAEAEAIRDEALALNKASAEADAERAARSAHQAMPEEAKARLANGKDFSAAEKEENFAKYGIAPEGESALRYNPETQEADLCPEARAAGLGLYTIQDEQGNTSQIVDGGNSQMAAFMSNEYGREITPSDASLPSDNYYRDSAIDALKTDPGFADKAEEFTADCDHLDRTALIDKWGTEIGEKASEFRTHDAESLAASNLDYANTLLRTAENMSSTAAIGAFFDTTKTMQGDDALGNAMMHQAFPELASIAGDGGFRNITAAALPDVTAPDGQSLYHGGRMITASYGTDGSETVVHIYSNTAYTAMTAAQQASLCSYEAADGRQLWVDTSFLSGSRKDGFSEQLERPSGRRQNSRANSHVQPPKKRR